MTTIAFDFETTGIPDWNARSIDPKQPHIVEMALIKYGDDGVEIGFDRVIVKPDGWTVPPDMTAIHGISHEQAMDEGIPEADAAAMFLLAMARANLRVAHSESFDRRIARIAMARAGFQRGLIEAFEALPAFCTCNSSKAAVNAPPTEKMLAKGMTGPKPPNLGECVRHFFPGEEVTGLHGALADARYCGRIYWEMMKGKPA